MGLVVPGGGPLTRVAVILSGGTRAASLLPGASAAPKRRRPGCEVSGVTPPCAAARGAGDSHHPNLSGAQSEEGI